MSSMGQGFPLGAGSPYETLGNDFEINDKLYPGLVLNPISTETNGLYSVMREINGSQWIMQNADVNAAGTYQINPAFPSKAFVLLAGGGLAMYTAIAGAEPGFHWTRQFYVDPSGVLQTPVAPVATNVFNVLNYGATGNGITDDTIAIQAAITACSAAGGGVVLFPQNTYLVTNTLTIPNGAGIKLQGQTKSTRILCSASCDIFVIENTTGGTVISYLQVQFETALLAGRCFVAMNVNTIRFDNVQTINGTVGYYLFDVGNVVLFECTTSGGTTAQCGIWIDGGAYYGGSNPSGGSINVFCIQCLFGGTSTGPALILGVCQTIGFLQCQFNGFDTGIEIGNVLATKNPDRGPNGVPTNLGTRPVWITGVRGILTQIIDFVACDLGQNQVNYGVYVHPPTWEGFPWNVVDLRFTQCHTVNGHGEGFFFTQDPDAGGTFGSIETVQITNCSATFCSGGSGIHLQAGRSYTISGGVYSANGSAGIFLDGSIGGGLQVSEVSITGIKAAQRVTNTAGPQNYGIALNGTGGADALTDVTITGCGLTNNSDAAIRWAGSPQYIVVTGNILVGQPSGIAAQDPMSFAPGFSAGVGVCVWDNVGYNDQSYTLTNTPPASNANVSSNNYDVTTPGGASGPYMGPMRVYLTGGFCTVSVGSAGSPTNTFLNDGTFVLQPNETIKIDYTGSGGSVPTHYLALGG